MVFELRGGENTRMIKENVEKSLQFLERKNLLNYLSDPSPIIGFACHSLTHCCLVNLIDVTLACEDGNSKLVEVVTVADVDDEKRFDDSFMQIWKEAEVWS